MLERALQPDRDQVRSKLAALERARQSMANSGVAGPALAVISTEIAKLKGALIGSKEPERRISDVQNYIQKQTEKVSEIREAIRRHTEEALTVSKDIAANRRYLVWIKWQMGVADANPEHKNPHGDPHTLEALLKDVQRSAEQLLEQEAREAEAVDTDNYWGNWSSWRSHWQYGAADVTPPPPPPPQPHGQNQDQDPYQEWLAAPNGNGHDAHGPIHHHMADDADMQDTIQFWQKYGDHYNHQGAQQPTAHSYGEQQQDGYEAVPASAAGFREPSQQTTEGKGLAVTSQRNALQPFRGASHRGQGAVRDDSDTGSTNPEGKTRSRSAERGRASTAGPGQ